MKAGQPAKSGYLILTNTAFGFKMNLSGGVAGFDRSQIRHVHIITTIRRVIDDAAGVCSYCHSIQACVARREMAAHNQ